MNIPYLRKRLHLRIFRTESVNLLRPGQIKKDMHANNALYALYTSRRSTSCITAINRCLFKKKYAITIAETIKNRKVVWHRVIDLFRACSLCGLKV